MKISCLIFIIGSFFNSGPKEVSCSDFYTYCEGENPVVIFDVRPLVEYRESRIPDAIYAGEKKVLLQRLCNLSKAMRVLVYCEYGDRSKTVMKILKRRGFKNIVHLKYGFTVWEKEGFPVDYMPIEVIENYK